METENKSHTPKEIRDEWQTPPALFWTLHREFSFEMDVAADHQNRLCSIYITKEEDALHKNWGNVNWCNPPYSNISPWVFKAMQQHTIGKTTVMLLPSDTSVRWFRDAYHTCNEVRFISGRLSFINAETRRPVSGNNKGSVLFIWRRNDATHQVKLIDRKELIQ